MATPSEKLAESLRALKDLQDQKDMGAIQASDLSRTHRERLVESGFLKEVMKGWYIATRPDEMDGDSTSWYASFWKFCSAYLQERFGRDWSLSPDQSLLIHAGNMTIPRQLLIRSPKGGNNEVRLPYNTSLFDIKGALPEKGQADEKDGLRIFTPASSLINASPGIFISNPTDSRAVLMGIRDASEVLPALLSGGHSVIAGRLAGAFRNVGKDKIANEIVKAMQSARYDVREQDPFTNKIITGIDRPVSPYVNRLRIMWAQMREDVLKVIPPPPGIPKDKASFLRHVQEVYVMDAYHSLSIEGYKVTADLIEKVMAGNWDPTSNNEDKKHRDAMAARGYYEAYQEVIKSLDKILAGNSPGTVASDDHNSWYRALFAPSVTVGLLKPGDLAGYRNDQVYIRGSMHVPLNRDAIKDAMPEFFELLRSEPEPGVRAILGHFMFVYIHPYMDGNGRTARFLMNAMLASGGYPWTIIPVESRKNYFGALERASVDQHISRFAEFISQLVIDRLKGKPLPQMPEH